jgi:hypothetical protein
MFFAGTLSRMLAAPLFTVTVRPRTRRRRHRRLAARQRL